MYLYTMRILMLYLFVGTLYIGHAQKPLKKKYSGVYEGEIPEYSIFNGDESMKISKSTISISLTKETISVKIGKLTYGGTYTWKIENKEIIILSTLDALTISEKMTIDVKSKEMIRFGRSPQPNSRLLKVKKLKT